MFVGYSSLACSYLGIGDHRNKPQVTGGLFDWVSFPSKTISPKCHFPETCNLKAHFPPNALFPQKRAN